MSRPLPASPKRNFPPSIRRLTCPGHYYSKLISETVLRLLRTLHALSLQKLPHHVMRHYPSPPCQLFLYPLIIRLPRHPFVTLLHVFRLINHGDSPALAIPFTLLWTPHSVWSLASRPAHPGEYLRHRPLMSVP